MARDDRQRWEARYATGDCGPGRAPSEFLVAHADLIHGRVLDVAAGSGRNALFLARRGNRVDAIDISLTGLRSARLAAVAEGIAVRGIQADLEDFPLPVGLYDAAINIRYLQRSLFVPLQRAVKPGGIILFETFLIGQQAFGHPRNPVHMLQPGELRDAFAGCEILVYREGRVDDAPEPACVARLLARVRHAQGRH
jgi:tellurite methyltransferase